MGTNKGRWRWVRRGAAALGAVLVLRGVIFAAGWQGLPGLTLRQEEREELSHWLLDAELGGRMEDEPSLWMRLVTSEVPALSVREAPLAGDDTAEENPPSDPEPEAEPEPEPEPEPEQPEPEPEPEPESPEPEPQEEAVSTTIGEGSATDKGGGVAITNSTEGITVDPEALAASVLTQTIRPASEGPQILIMHTHATEAYTMDGADIYTPTDNSRTDDPNYNVIRVGEEIKSVFEEMGFSVIHDFTLYDYPRYKGSYGRSLAGVQAMLDQYPSISVVLDVHRDAMIAADGTVYKAVTQLDGQSCAQVMLVVGSNDGGLEHPDWLEHLELAAHIQMEMNAIEPTLARPIHLRAQRFNQHLTQCSLLVEVGTSGNTLQEALLGARNFARAAGTVFQTLVTEE